MWLFLTLQDNLKLFKLQKKVTSPRNNPVYKSEGIILAVQG